MWVSYIVVLHLIQDLASTWLKSIIKQWKFCSLLVVYDRVCHLCLLFSFIHTNCGIEMLIFSLVLSHSLLSFKFMIHTLMPILNLIFVLYNLCIVLFTFKLIGPLAPFNRVYNWDFTGLISLMLMYLTPIKRLYLINMNLQLINCNIILTIQYVTFCCKLLIWYSTSC